MAKFTQFQQLDGLFYQVSLLTVENQTFMIVRGCKFSNPFLGAVDYFQGWVMASPAPTNLFLGEGDGMNLP